MVVRKEIKHGGFSDIILENDNKLLTISYLSNGDLYWSLHETDIINNVCDFIISKANFHVHKIFDVLYNKIKNCEVHMIYASELKKCSTEEEKEQYYERVKLNNKRFERKQESNPRKLFKNDVVEFHSEEKPYEEASTLKIIKDEDDNYILRFEKSKDEAVSEDYGVLIKHPSYNEITFKTLFMLAFLEFQKYNSDDIQIYIDELGYQKQLKRKTV